jgi:hypothetical protein
MNGLTYTKDIRYTDPDESPNRLARFKVGWDRGADNYIYGEDALDELTWENLGNRLGAILCDAPPELQEELYAVCVNIQEWQNRKI